jgi:hypothetical protein
MFSEITQLFSGLLSTIIAPDLKWAKEHSCTIESALIERMPAVFESFNVSPLKLEWNTSMLEFGNDKMQGTFLCNSLLSPSRLRMQLFSFNIPDLTRMIEFKPSFI